ncbi:deaminase [Xanthomonas oryzae]|uniref:deaminase n=1 Tax=Xanthomonas oryzae TaxID=347 RepID=UPI001430471B
MKPCNGCGLGVFQGRLNNITKFHAEGNAAQQAIDAGMVGKHRIAEMWVDRDLCHACGPSNGVGSLARALGLDAIIVHTPSGTRKFNAPCAG